jgi:hypothetical protein
MLEWKIDLIAGHRWWHWRRCRRSVEVSDLAEPIGERLAITSRRRLPRAKFAKKRLDVEISSGARHEQGMYTA